MGSLSFLGSLEDNKNWDYDGMLASTFTTEQQQPLFNNLCYGNNYAILWAQLSDSHKCSLYEDLEFHTLD